MSRLRPEKHRIRPLHRWAVVGPAVALAQVVGRLGDFGVGLACQFAAVPAARGQGLVGGSRHVEQHLAQVGAALGAADVFVDDFAPAPAHGLANQLVHAVRRAGAMISEPFMAGHSATCANQYALGFQVTEPVQIAAISPH